MLILIILGAPKGHLSVGAPGSSERDMVWEEGAQPWSSLGFPP